MANLENLEGGSVFPHVFFCFAVLAVLVVSVSRPEANGNHAEQTM